MLRSWQDWQQEGLQGEVTDACLCSCLPEHCPSAGAATPTKPVLNSSPTNQDKAIGGSWEILSLWEILPWSGHNQIVSLAQISRNLTSLHSGMTLQPQLPFTSLSVVCWIYLRSRWELEYHRGRATETVGEMQSHHCSVLCVLSIQGAGKCSLPSSSVAVHIHPPTQAHSLLCSIF